MNRKNTLPWRYKNFLIRAFVLVVMVFVATRLILPTVENITETQSKIIDEKERLSNLTKKEEFLKSVNRERLSQQARKLSEALPSAIDLPLILATLQKVAFDTDVTLGEFSLSSTSQALIIIPVQQAEKLSSFQFRVNLSGTLENMERFIKRLGFVSPMLSMEGIEFDSITSKATINFYFQLQPASKPPVDAPLTELTVRHTKAINDVFALEPPVLEEPLVATPSGVGDRESPFR